MADRKNTFTSTLGDVSRSDSSLSPEPKEQSQSKHRKRMSLPYRNVPNSPHHDRIESLTIDSLERPRAKIQEVTACSDRRDTDSLVGSFESFNVFTGLINYPELLFEVAGHLDLEDLISLYAISRDFHNVMNTRFTAMIICQSRVQSPESSRVFSFRAYRTLCQGDPSGQQNEEKVEDVRLVPTFRWLRMIYFRDKVVQDIIRNLAAAGHMLPPRASLVLKKVWMALDIGTNAKRIGLFHNLALWSDEDLYIATMFFIKLDMRLSDPVDGCGESTFRKMMMGQRSLSILYTCLNAGGRLRQLDILQMYVRWAYKPSPEHQNLRILGVRVDEIGKGCLEGWGAGTRVLLRPDELVMREGLRRGLNMQHEYLEMMLWGYVDLSQFDDGRVHPHGNSNADY